MRAIPSEAIEANEVLLIQSIGWADDKPHTIILRAHPSKYGQQIEMKRTDERGRNYSHWIYCTEHRFLLDDFLSSFEFEPDYERVRAHELKAVQQKITQLQTELIETQSDPARLAPIIEAGLREMAEEEDEPRSKKKGNSLPAELTPPPGLADLATGTVSNALSSGVTEQGIEQLKAAANRQHQIATVQSKWIQGKTQAIAQTIQAMTPFFEEKAAAALAHTEETRTYVSKLMQGIESLDLYVGKGVEVETLRTGTPAPAEEPLTFMQKKLMMDEELAVWADVNEKFDFSSEDVFFQALRDREGLVKQIFATPRCVLVMAATRRVIDYGDPWVNLARAGENKKVFLLVRNGENLYRVFSSVESHLGTSRLFPSKNEQDRVFQGLDGSQIKFDDVAYTDRLKEHEIHALHYKRFLLLCCGLDHRLKLFGEFYSGPQSFDFVSLAFQAQYCRFVHDDEPSQLLGEDRLPVLQWIKAKNAYLRSGSRVLCNWRELMNPTTAPSACFERSERRYGYERRYEPAFDHDVCIAYRDGRDFCVDIEVTGRTVRQYESRTFQCKVNLSLFKDGDWDYTDQAYLCLDAVTAEELSYYIHHRTSRKHHLDYIRFFKRALAHVQGEHAEEAKARAGMRRALLDSRLCDDDGADALIDQAVSAWRAANRGKKLPDYNGSLTPAWKSLHDQMYMLAGAGRGMVSEAERFVLDLGLKPLRMVLSGSAKTCIYAAPREEERDDRLIRHAWVHLVTLERGKSGLKEKSRRWALLPPRAASETTLHEWSEAKEWTVEHSPFRSPQHKRQALAIAEQFAEPLRRWASTMSDAEYAQHFTDWQRARDALSGSGQVLNPEIAMPIGLVYYPRSQRLAYICVSSRDAHGLLHRHTRTPAQADKVRKLFIESYAKRDYATTLFEASIANRNPWTLLEVRTSSVDRRFGVFLPEAEIEGLRGRGYDDPRLGSWLASFVEETKDHANVWLAPGVFDEIGACQIDTIIDTYVPEDFELLTVDHVELHVSDEEPSLPTYHEWFDIKPRERSSGIIVPVRHRRPADFGDFNHSSSSYLANSRSGAHALIAEHTPAKRRAVPASSLADAPKTPKGIERWYVIDAPKTG